MVSDIHQAISAGNTPGQIAETIEKTTKGLKILLQETQVNGKTIVHLHPENPFILHRRSIGNNAVSIEGKQILIQEILKTVDGLDPKVIQALKLEIEKLTQQTAENIELLKKLQSTLPDKEEFHTFILANKNDLARILTNQMEYNRKLSSEEKEELLTTLNKFFNIEDSTKFVMRLPLLVGYLEKSFNIKVDTSKVIAYILNFFSEKSREPQNRFHLFKKRLKAQ